MGNRHIPPTGYASDETLSTWMKQPTERRPAAARPVVPWRRRRPGPAAGQPAGWIDLTEMNWIGSSISAFGPCGTSPTNCMASPGSSR
jgi:hypothetical protein